MKLFDPPRLTGKYLSEVLSSGWLTTGPMCDRLREKTAEFLRVRKEQVVLAASATAGFQGVLDLIRRRGPKGEGLPYCHSICGPSVQITDATWPGMHQCIPHAYCSRAGEFGAAEPKIVVLTDIGGRREIDDISLAPGLSNADPKIYIHDACHSWRPDTVADFGIVSFYPTKLVPGAEGGAVICKKEEDADELRAWLYCGLSPGAAGNGLAPSVPGRKANMTDVTAALNAEALELAPAHIDATEDAWYSLAALARVLGVPYRDQPVRPYLFQVDVSNAVPSVMGLPRGVPEIRWCLANHPDCGPAIPTAWNFRPAPLVTVPCHRGADPRVVMEAVAEVL